MIGCETCNGRGEIPNPGPDPYEKPRKIKPYGLHEYEERREQAAVRNRQINDLERDARRRAGEIIRDDAYGWEKAKAYAYSHGSYAELDRALERLRAHDEAWFHVAIGVSYQPLHEEPIEPVRRAVLAVCALLACWMPDPIRVPPGVPTYTTDELERHSREAKDALHFGRSDWARATRAERKRVILLLHAEGLPDGKIASRFGLTRQWVQRIRSGLNGAIDETNGHEEAA